MHDIRKINVMENIMDENDHIAEHVNEHMSAHGVLVINEMGAPGVGKTLNLSNRFERLAFSTSVRFSLSVMDFFSSSICSCVIVSSLLQTR